jgi:hypothetical protein
MNERTLVEILRRLINQEIVYLRHYYGKIVDVNDPLELGRVKVEVPELGIDSGIGMWCSSRSKTSLTTPKQEDWVEVYFMAGDRNKPVYIGEAMEMENMIPRNYKKKATSQIIFEDPQDKTHIAFDADLNEMEIGNTDMQFVARVNDQIQASSVTDSVFWVWLGAVSTALSLTAPPSLTGKITTGSTQVKAGSK